MIRRANFVVCSALFAGLSLAGCKKEQEVERDPRLITAPDADMAVVVEGNSAFAMDIYQQLATGEDNLFLSPFSISAALAMTLVGAEGETQSQMEDVLQVMLEESTFHEDFGALMRDLGGDHPGRGYTLNVANRIYAQQGYGWDAGFIAVNEDDYGAPFEELDISADPEAARAIINAWVAEQTRDKIPELYQVGDINDNTRMALTNAIYFKADWAEQFEEDRTWDEDFTTLAGDQVSVPMMHREGEMALGYDNDAGVSVLRLPYLDDEVSMVILLPDEERTVLEVEALMTPDTLAGWLGDLHTQEVQLALPRWEMRYRFILSEVLAAMGMPDAFDPVLADFSGMTGDDNGLYISKVIHEAYVKVDEEGTEAAAATGVTMEDSAPAFEEFNVNRPFTYLIRDDLTGSILFMGRVVDPSAG